MATTGLGIMQTADGTGTDPITFRRITKAKWENTGIITGLSVSGRTNLSYAVSAGCAVVSRSDSDGYVEAYWEGGNTPAVSAGDPSNPRIDAIWIKANDKQQGDDDNLVEVGVAQGTPAASPVTPAVPTGALIISKMRVPASATSTNSAQQEDYGDQAIPYGASLGLLGENINTADQIGDSTPRKWFYENPIQFTVPTDRLIELVYSCTFTNVHQSTGLEAGFVVWGVGAFQLDGKDIPHSGTEWLATNGAWEDHQVSCIVEVSKGTHTVRVRNGVMNHEDPDGAPYFRYSESNGVSYKGRTLRAWDRGVAR